MLEIIHNVIDFLRNVTPLYLLIMGALALRAATKELAPEIKNPWWHYLGWVLYPLDIIKILLRKDYDNE